MKPTLILTGLLLSLCFVRGQVNVPDTAIIVNWHNVFSGKCMIEIAGQYEVEVFMAPVTCVIDHRYSEDSLEKHNKHAEQYYSTRLDTGWLKKMLEEISVCERSTCNRDSVEKYSDYGIGGSNVLLMKPGSDSIHPVQYCLLDNSIIYFMLRYKTMRIEIESHAIPGEEEYSIKRAEKARNYLISKGVEPERIVIGDIGTQYPRLCRDPDHPMNCRLYFAILEY